MLSWFRKKSADPQLPLLEQTPAAAVLDVDAATVFLDQADQDGSGWMKRLSQGLAKSTGKLTDSLADLVTKRKLDAALLEHLEETLIAADLGPRLAAAIAAEFGKQRFGQAVDQAEIKAYLATAIAARLEKTAQPLTLDETRQPFVVLMVGVNGSGKTTTLGKLAAQLNAEGKRVRMVAGDTFRAAAGEQLQAWGRRAGVDVVMKSTGADAAGLAYEAYMDAKRDMIDVLLIDTAGRLQNKAELMAELQKLVRALRKVDATAPHACLLVLDATVGQNALSQAALFREAAPVSGLIVTKLDGTAKGGIVVALADQQALPILGIGVGEQLEDLQPFEPIAFARALVGLGTLDAAL